MHIWNCFYKRNDQNFQLGSFPAGSVVKNLHANAGDMGSIPEPGRFHMPWDS